MKKAVFALGALAIGLVTADAAAKWVRGGDASVTFLATGPGGLQIKGSGTDLTVDDKGDTVTVVVPLKDIDTGIALRNKHMRDKYLEVEKFPEATLAVPLDAITFAADGKTSEGSAKGTFSVHGKSKEVSFKYKMTNTGGTCAIEGEAAVNFKDFDVNVPSYMGITVKPDITVFSKFGAKKG